jgi:ADP-ribose pyrophosphatase YjhB (NUDIX family)
MENSNPRIGVAAIIRKDGKVLLGQRNADGEAGK